MTSAAEPELAIYLLPLENPGSGPLRRLLDREAWRADPAIWLCYDAAADRVAFRIIDAPSIAVGVADKAASGPAAGAFDAGRAGAGPAGDVFLGFDAATGAAWPTTVALLAFGRHCDQDTDQLRLVRAVVGAAALDAAVALRRAAGGGQAAGREQTVTLPPGEAVRLIRRWSDLVVTFDHPGPSDAELAVALTAWSGAAGSPAAEPEDGVKDEVPAGQLTRPAAAGASRSGDPLPPPDRELLSVAPNGTLSRSSALERKPIEDGRPAAVSEPAEVGAVMARKANTAEHGEPLGALHYGLLARLTDAWSGRRDGKAGIPALPAAARPGETPGAGVPREVPETGDPREVPGPNGPREVPETGGVKRGITPYLEIRNRHFLDCAERERRRMLADLADTYRALSETRQEIEAATEHASAVSGSWQAMPAAPAEPDRRNVLELHAPEALVRARRLREHQRARDVLAAREQQARQAIRDLRKQEAALAETIAVREQLLDSQVRQLFQHTQRRCGTYLRHLAHHHPDGAAVIDYLELALPAVPGWLPATLTGTPRTDARRKDEPEGPHIQSVRSA